MNWLMLSCKKATELIEKKALLKITFKEKIQLQMHKSMCSACTAYEKQSKKLDELFLKHINNDNPEVSTLVQNEDLKSKILKNLGEQ